MPANRSSSANVMNFQGSYTPTGTTTTGVNNYYGSGMWFSSPVDATGAPLAGRSTLAAGATFKMDFKIVATQSSQTQLRTQSGWGSPSSLSADTTSNTGAGRRRIATNGVSETLTWSPWTTSTTTWRLNSGTNKTLHVGTGTLTMKTNADLIVPNGGTANSPAVQYNQLMLIPGLFSVAGLGNGTMLYCSTLEFVSGAITTTVGGTRTDQVAELGTVQSYVRAQYDYGYNGDKVTQYTGTC